MNQRDELDRKLMAWLDDPFTPPAPTYLGEVLDRTRMTRQRRAWASLERWLPMTLTLRRPMLALPTRLLALGLALILALLAALALAPILSSPNHLPAAVTKWSNGLVAFGRDGDIWIVDPQGGEARVLIGGPAFDDEPDWSPDGTRIAFWRTGVGTQKAGGSPAQALMVANADGSNVTQVTTVPVIDPTGLVWSPDGSQLVLASTVKRYPTISLVAADGSGTRSLDLGVPADQADWHPDGKSLLVRAGTPNGTSLFSVSLPDGVLSAPIVTSDVTSAYYAGDRGVNDFLWPTYSPDGSRIAYTNGQSPVDGHQGVFGGPDTRNHIVAADGSGDRVVEYSADSDYEDDASWSPDGTRLSMVTRSGDVHHLVIASSDGSADMVASSPQTDRAALWTGWAPDGKSILMIRDSDGVRAQLAMLVDARTGETTPAPWLGGTHFDWQPVAAQP